MFGIRGGNYSTYLTGINQFNKSHKFDPIDLGPVSDLTPVPFEAFYDLSDKH